jgi:apolipoprotein N-acyltransferase
MGFFYRYSVWLALPVGAALSLAFAPFNLWPLAIVCPAFLFLAWQDATPKRAAKIGFLFTAGTYLAGTYWLYHSIYVIGQAPLFVAIVLMLGLVSIMGGYMALVAYVQARWFPKSGHLRFLIALPAAWLLLEWLRGWLFSGFPWLAIGYAGIDTPLAGFAPIVGVYGVGWLFAVMGGAVAALILKFLSASVRPELVEGFLQVGQEKSGALRRVQGERSGILIAGAALVLPWLIAYPLWNRDWTEPVDGPITVAIVQGAVPQEMKWSQEQHDATLKLYHDLTVPHWGAQLIVWPESALPDWAEQLTDYFSNVWQEATVHRSHLLTGIQHYDTKTDKAYNSVLALGDHVQWYSKNHLVPFGEYFPVPEFVRSWMRMMSLPHSDFSSGGDGQPALLAAGQKIGVTICYEDAYGSTQLYVLKEATLLVNVTNDAWFGDSTARHQHLQISRMRALEAGRPLLRAANDGISGIIDSHGKLVSQLPSFKSEVLTGSVQPRIGLTPYARMGNWLVISWCAVLLVIACVASRRRRFK